jgi:hypothetical protein
MALVIFFVREKRMNFFLLVAALIIFGGFFFVLKRLKKRIYMLENTLIIMRCYLPHKPHFFDGANRFLQFKTGDIPYFVLLQQYLKLPYFLYKEPSVTSEKYKLLFEEVSNLFMNYKYVAPDHQALTKVDCVLKDLFKGLAIDPNNNVAWQIRYMTLNYLAEDLKSHTGRTAWSPIKSLLTLVLNIPQNSPCREIFAGLHHALDSAWEDSLKSNNPEPRHFHLFYKDELEQQIQSTPLGNVTLKDIESVLKKSSDDWLNYWAEEIPKISFICKDKEIIEITELEK